MFFLNKPSKTKQGGYMKSLKFLMLLLIAIPILFSCESSTEVNTVANPVINPAGGTYTSVQNISISCATTDAIIKYTIDGTAPDTSATAITYLDPIPVAMNMIIKAVAMKDGWNDSNIVHATYMIYPDMAHVPAGTFTMGRTKASGLAEFDDELPTHSVTLTAAFYIGMYEVKQSEWFAVIGANPSHFVGDTNRPVEMVSWYATLVYCNKRSMMEGLTPVYSISGSTDPANWGNIPTTSNAAWDAANCNWSADGYRLPTEAEWEYAARGATNTPDFLFAGDDNVSAVSWYATNSGNTTHPVGLKNPNGLGIYDMSGNVGEWCWDWYGATYYSTSPSTNPTGPAMDAQHRHTIRGGSWFHQASSSRVVYRDWGTPEKDSPKVLNNRLGFRVVRLAV